MCGIFGYVKNGASTGDPNLPTLIVKELGTLSISRGKDSSGVAFIQYPADSDNYVEASDADLRRKTLRLNNSIIHKASGNFTDFWDDSEMGVDGAESHICIGHTRHATQGNKTDLANMSPLALGRTIGTHNGDVTKSSARYLAGNSSSRTIGQTDTEVLYRSLNLFKGHRKKISKHLSDTVGRIALVWYDFQNPYRLMMTRGALSPLAIAYDNFGNLYWASNPNWFRIIQNKYNNAITFDNIVMVGEGTLLTIEWGYGKDNESGKPYVSDVRDYHPQSRESDENLLNTAVWKDFDGKDKDADRLSFRRNVLPAPKVETLPTSRFAASTASTYGATSNYRSQFRDREGWGNVTEPNSHGLFDSREEDMWVEDDQDFLEELYDTKVSELEFETLQGFVEHFFDSEVIEELGVDMDVVNGALEECEPTVSELVEADEFLGEYFTSNMSAQVTLYDEINSLGFVDFEHIYRISENAYRLSKTIINSSR